MPTSGSASCRSAADRHTDPAPATALRQPAHRAPHNDSSHSIGARFASPTLTLRVTDTAAGRRSPPKPPCTPRAALDPRWASLLNDPDQTGTALAGPPMKG